MAAVDLEYNKGFQIYNSDGTLFHDLVLHKCTYETVVMSLGDKISGILYYKDNALDVKMTEYIIYKGVKYTLVNPPTILKEGLVSDNGELKGMTKYSFTFYHPMYVLNNFSFNDVAVSSDQNKYLSQNKTFSWIGNLNDYVAKINKNLQGTEWFVKVGENVTQEEKTKLSDVLSFDKNTIAEALKRGYETWEVPYIVDQVKSGTTEYNQGKRFVVQYGLPTTEITVKDDNDFETPYVFKMGQGVGLKNNSRNPKNNKIITRIAGYGSEDNIPYGYPQIRYYGGNVQYPLYYGIVGGQRVQLIKHPFTRNHLMPSVYSQAVYNKVNPKLSDGSNNPNYNPNIELVDYYDADSTYENPIKSGSPSYEIHEFGDIKPELGEETIINAVPVNAQETQSDYKQKSDFLQEILNRISSTDIDDEKVCLKTLYDKIDAGLSYYAQKGEEGGSEYWYRISVTSDEYYQYVSYESGNYNFTATVLKNDSSAPTPDWDDTMDDDGNYLQSYFKITLPILSFDLYACAAITQEMKINMRSGACIGCTFPVQVDWDDYKRNFYNSDGEFDPDGEQRDYTKYPDSSSGQITVMVKKELETFGTLMPNQYQQPTTGDKFVILGISLPESYITNAEQRLDTDMKQYMRDNNVYYYEYPLKFDEHFLISNENILSQMKPNVVVRFEYAGETHALYIKQMSVKYNESPLPKYDITLTDDIEIVLNQIGQVTDEVSKLRLGLGENGIGGNGQEYLRKDIDDTARGTIRMIKGMQVGERFVTGLLGEGGVFRKDVDGTTYLETDKLYVRMKAYFDTVEVKHYLHTGGNRIASQASGIVCSRVEYIDNNGDVTTDLGEAVLFRCYFKANDGDKTIRNDFTIGDLAFCRETNVDVSDVNMHGYWRLVVGRNGNGSLTENKEGWIDLSNRASETLTIDGKDYVCNGYQNGSDAPIAQDDIIQLGNIVNTDRQGAIVEYVGGEDAPSYQIFQGIGSDLPYPYTLEDKNYIGIGYSSQTGRAYMNVYGDAYIGDPDGSTFIKYEQEDSQTHQPKMTIKAVVEFQSPDDPTQTTTLEQFASAITTDIENIQSQIDGEIDTWFYAGVPTLQNAPANEWTTDAEKEKHAGDLYYDIGTGTDAGKAYRFVRSQDKPYVYSWQYIDDTAITEALRIAAHAQDTADHKRRVFVAQPTPPYDEGDLWVNATYVDQTTQETVYDDDILKCITPKTEGRPFSITDWELASKYTDDTAFNKFFADTYQPFVTQIQSQVDGKAETWYQSTDPSAAWNTPELKQAHVGDIWHNTSSATVSGVEAGQDAIWSGSEWKPSTVPQEVYDKIDGKASIYTDTLQDPPTNYKENDLWIIPADYTINGVAYKKGEVLTATSDSVGFNQAHWTKKVRYTDDSSLNDFKANKYVTQLTNGTISTNITNAQNAANAAQQAADDAQADADAAAAAAANAQTSANSANNRLDGWANDGSISPTEKTSLKLEWENVEKEYTQICNDADKYGVSKTAFASAYTSANAAFQKYTAATPENITISADYNNIAAYYAARQTILDAITQAAKKVATDAATAAANAQAKADSAYTLAGNAQSAAQAAEAHAATLDYVKTALKQDTIIDGGLVISTLLAMRDGNNKIWSGINGAYNSAETGAGYKGHGIASWYGGAMVDKEVTTTATDYAKSLFRFDGSGYLAGGNITWDKNGIVTIANVYANIGGTDTSLTGTLQTLTNLSNALPLSLQSGVTYLDPKYSFTKLSVLGKPVATQEWVGQNYLSIAFFKRLFQAHNGSANVNPNDTTTTITDIEAMFGFWTKQYISALGKNDSGGSGGGVDMTTVWSALGNATSEQINASHLQNVAKPLQFFLNENTSPSYTYTGTNTVIVNGLATASWVKEQLSTSVDGLTTAEAPIDRTLSLQIKVGQVAIGTSVGKAYSGSSSDYNLWCFPSGATVINSNTSANIQVIRFVWGKTFFRDIFMSPNNDYILHRAVGGGVSGDWYMIPQFKYINNSIGVGSATKPVYINGQGRLVEANSYPSTLDDIADGTTRKLANYLPLTGGTMTGMLHAKHVFEVYNGDANTKQSSYMRFVRNGANGNDYAALGWSGNDVRLAVIGGTGNYQSEVTILEVGYNGQLKLSATNGISPITTDSTTLVANLNADMLDGLHGTRYLASYNRTEIGVSPNFDNPSRTNSFFELRSTAEIPNATGTRPPNIVYAPFLSLKTPDNTAMMQICGYNYYGWFVRGKQAANVTLDGVEWQQLARTTDNVASATKLQNTRKLWGQNFDGTADVTGFITVDLSSNGETSIGTQRHVLRAIHKNAGGNAYTVNNNIISLFGSGETTTNNNNPIRIGSQSGATWISAGESGITLSSVFTGMCNTENLYLTSDGGIFIYSGLANDSTNYETQLAISIDRNARIGIGTASPSYKLHVNGTFYASGNSSIGGTFGVTGAATLSSTLTVSGSVGIGTSSPSTSLHVIGRVTCEYADSTTLGSFSNIRGDYLSNYGINSSGFTVITTGQKGASSSTVRISMTPYTATEPYVMIGRDSSLVLGSTGIASNATYRDGTFIQIGGARIVWDNANTALKVVRSDGTSAANFYATGAVSALGANASGGSGSGIDANWLKTNDVEIKRLGIGVEPSSSYQLNVQGSSSFTGAVTINNALTVNNSVSAIGGFSTSQGSISAAHNITAGDNGLIHGRLTVGQSTVNTSYNLYVNGTSYFNGNVGIGTTGSTAFKLDVNGVARATELRLTHGFYIDWNNSNSNAYTIGHDQEDVYADGDWYGRWVSSSDVRLKDIDQYLDSKLENIALAPIFTFRWKNKPNKPLELGTSAQYWKEHLPYGVTQAHSGYLALDYGATALAAAVFTARKVVDHELRIKQLEQENAILREEIKSLKAA